MKARERKGKRKNGAGGAGRNGTHLEVEVARTDDGQEAGVRDVGVVDEEGGDARARGEQRAEALVRHVRVSAHVQDPQSRPRTDVGQQAQVLIAHSRVAQV